MNDDSGNAIPDTGRKRPRRSESGSQTEDNGSCNGCCSMAEIIAEMNRKLDLALARTAEIDGIITKQKQLENTNANLEKSWSLLRSPSELCLNELPLKKRNFPSWRKV